MVKLAFPSLVVLRLRVAGITHSVLVILISTIDFRRLCAIAIRVLQAAVAVEVCC